MVVEGWQSCCLWLKNPRWKTKYETVHCRHATASSFVSKVRGEVFAHFCVVTVENFSNMWNWLFGLPGRILCEQSSWYQRKWWACSLLFTCLAFFGLGEFRLSAYGSYFLPWKLV
jgi:hypothetical protein